VTVEINESDTTLRPAMSTANEIITDVEPKAIYVPLESVFNQGDSISYVYKKSGLEIIKQEVVLGKANANEVIVKEGIGAGEKLYLIAPADLDGKEVTFLKSPEL
jgi:hypothetical protein